MFNLTKTIHTWHYDRSIYIHLSICLILGLMSFPLLIGIIGSTHDINALSGQVFSLWPGDHWIDNMQTVLSSNHLPGSPSIWLLLFNSFILAMSIAFGKVILAILSAFALVFFRMPCKMILFGVIFLTLMLPLEVRLYPTHAVVVNLGLYDSPLGLSLPLIASATATFLLRQFFCTVPDELLEASLLDNTGPTKFLRSILLPLSKANLAALFIIMFIYGWNQYLWPLVMTLQENKATIFIGIQRLLAAESGNIDWPIVMTVSLIAMLPPMLIIIVMRRHFIQGLIDQEK